MDKMSASQTRDRRFGAYIGNASMTPVLATPENTDSRVIYRI